MGVTAYYEYQEISRTTQFDDLPYNEAAYLPGGGQLRTYIKMRPESNSMFDSQYYMTADLLGGLPPMRRQIDYQDDFYGVDPNAGADYANSYVRYYYSIYGSATLVTGLVTYHVSYDSTNNSIRCVNNIRNAIEAGGGNDVIASGNLADSISGGDGDDTVTYANSIEGVQVDLSANGPQLSTGDASGDQLYSVENVIGSAQSDRLVGSSGNNRLEGGASADDISGGIGLDVASYASSASAVQVDLNLTGQQVSSGDASGDTLVSIEGIIGSKFNDTLTGDARSNSLSGGDGTDTLTGSDGNDTLDGGAGTDLLDGGLGADTASYGSATAAVRVDLAVTNAQDTLGAGIDTLIGIENVTGSAFNDRLLGDGAANILNGGDGNDTLDGRGGVDTMTGGRGDDVYYVDTLADVIREYVGQGTDTIYAGFDYTLGATVENLTLTGTGNLAGTGNSLANTLVGNTGSNRLDGKVGIDTMKGGTGDDTYVVDNAGDAVIEYANQGNDTVEASTTYTIANNIETLRLTGSSSIAGTGNGLANTLIGNSGNNMLTGAGGADTLTGNGGADTFVFRANWGKDTITDFAAGASGTDRVQFDKTLFANYADLMAHTIDSGAGAVVSLNASNSITFTDVTKAQFASGDFTFV